MDELMKSFGLIADEDMYWFVTHEDKVRGNFLVITYPDRIIAHRKIDVIQNTIYYTDLVEVIGYKKAKATVASLLKRTKEIKQNMRLEKVRSDFV